MIVNQINTIIIMKTILTFITAVTALTSFATAKIDIKPALDGYCPVCYIAAGKANKGKAEFASKYEGKTYYFVSKDVKGMFDAEPTKWLPQYDGYCAFGISLNKKFESDPTVFTVDNGKVYLNKDAEIGKKFRQDQAKLIKQADVNWKNIMMQEAKPALGGYCPVCYIAAGKANKGKAEFSSKYEGKTYYFVSKDVKGMFDAEPTKWLPQYDGYCAYGISLGKKFESDPTVFTVENGKVYLNKDAEIGKKFRSDQAALIKQADVNWKKLMK